MNKYSIFEETINYFRIKFDNTFECLAHYQNGYLLIHYYKNGDILKSYMLIASTKENNIAKAIEYYENTIKY